MAINQFPESVPSQGGGPLLREAVLTSSQTWTHPDGASAEDPKEIFVIARSGGGGGGSGVAIRVTGSDQPAVRGTAGGGGGAGAVIAQKLFVTQNVSVTVGSGGAGGSAVTTTAIRQYLDGDNGGFGGNTILSQSTDLMNSIFAPGGHGGESGRANLNNSSLGQIYSYYLNSKGGLGSSVGGEAQWPLAQTNNAFNGLPGSSQARGMDALGQSSIMAQLSSGSGGGGGSVYSVASGGNFRGNLGGAGGASTHGNGGAGGNAEYSNHGSLLAQSGGNATGNSAGGGGGGSVIANSNVTSGAGGNGSAGQVIIYY